jgi:hypothetical protein
MFRRIDQRRRRTDDTGHEGIDLISILNSLRMILPTGSLSDFESAAVKRGKRPRPNDRSVAAP